jgi:anti-sigma factor RsiW
LTEAEEKALRLQAALDGELDAAGMLAFERACAEDPALAAEIARLKALDEALRRAAPIEPAPEFLRARMAALGAPAPPQRRPNTFFSAPPRALAASLLLGLLIGYGGGLLRPEAPPQDERALVSAFMRAQIGGQSVDVATSDRHVVKPWLAGRAPLAIAAVDLAASGFPLAGGRVEALDGRVVPTLVYRRREHRIEVTELPLAGKTSEPVTRSGFEGYHVVRWSDGDRAYVAVSDLPATELADFVALFRAAVAAEREGGPAK